MKVVSLVCMLSNGSVLSIYIAHSTSLQPSDLVVSMWDDDVELSVLVLLPNFLLSFLTCSSGTQGKSRRVKAKTSGSFAGRGGWLPSTLEGKEPNENFSFFLGL